MPLKTELIKFIMKADPELKAKYLNTLNISQLVILKVEIELKQQKGANNPKK